MNYQKIYDTLEIERRGFYRMAKRMPVEHIDTYIFYIESLMCRIERDHDITPKLNKNYPLI